MNVPEIKNLLAEGVVYPAEYTDLVDVPLKGPERFAVHYSGRTFFIEVSEISDAS